MKILGKIESKQGHKKMDYLCTLSLVEIATIRHLLNHSKTSPKRYFRDGSAAYNAVSFMRDTLRPLKLNVKID